MSRRGALGLVLALTCLLVAPAAAWGKWVPSFRLPGTHGYGIVLSGHDQTVILSATHPSHPPRARGGFSTYIARGRANSTRVEATFGDLGRVAVKFHPSGKVKLGRSLGHCPGRSRKVTRYGYFAGDVHFTGEGGYTSVHAHRVKGEIVSRPSLICRIIGSILGGGPLGTSPPANKSKGKETSLTAAFESGVTGTEFKATTNRLGQTRFNAVTERTVGRLGIYRGAFAKAPSEDFDFDSKLSFGSVAPPFPFAGTASLQRNPDGTKSWTGPLSVSFPGESNVPLTGPQFKAQLSQSF
jgi:hypothetical protein